MWIVNDCECRLFHNHPSPPRAPLLHHVSAPRYLLCTSQTPTTPHHHYTAPHHPTLPGSRQGTRGEKKGQQARRCQRAQGGCRARAQGGCCASQVREFLARAQGGCRTCSAAPTRDAPPPAFPFCLPHLCFPSTSYIAHRGEVEGKQG